MAEEIIEKKAREGRADTTLDTQRWLLFQWPSECRQTEWDEFDLKNAIWVMPAIKMKIREPGTAPLSRQALTILREMNGCQDRGACLPVRENEDGAHQRRYYQCRFAAYRYSKDQMRAHGFRASASPLRLSCSGCEA